MIKLLRRLFSKSLPNGEHPVAPGQPCEYCGSGVLKIVIAEERCALRCMQCFRLDLDLTKQQAQQYAREFAWRPAQSGRRQS